MTSVDTHGKLASYAHLIRDCVAGRRSASLILGGSVRRWRVRRWLARNPGRRFECRIPTGGKLLLDTHHWFVEHYYAGLSAFEPDVQRALTGLLKDGGTFVDCGANVGFYSVLANDLMKGTGRVIAIEANSALLPLLNSNLQGNGIRDPAVHAAIAAQGGVVDFLVPRMDLWGGLKRTAQFRHEEVTRTAVPAMTFDEAIDSRALTGLDVVKIDIEGGELDALRGGERTILRFRPTLIVEYSSINWHEYGASPSDLRSLCDKWGYRICRYDLARDAPVEVEGAFWDEVYANMILIPVERP